MGVNLDRRGLFEAQTDAMHRRPTCHLHLKWLLHNKLSFYEFLLASQHVNWDLTLSAVEPFCAHDPRCSVLDYIGHPYALQPPHGDYMNHRSKSPS